MITKFKIFESINEGEPKIGDYVICSDTYLKQHLGNLSYGPDSDFYEFVSSNIGQYIKNYHNQTSGAFYAIYYKNLDVDKFKDYLVDVTIDGKTFWCRLFAREEILAFGKTEEEVKIKLLANKFNL